jgi:hypothetical protein
MLLSGMLAGVPGQGGASWAVLQYLLGLRRLGHRVVFVEPVSDLRRSARYLRGLAKRFDLTAALVDRRSGQTVGLSRRELLAAADDAELILNLSGTLADEELLERVPLRAFVDLDPAFTQLWHTAEGIDLGLDRHNRFVTVGQALGSDRCTVPTCGRDWITTPQPIVLEHWPASDTAPRGDALTTVGHWRSYGAIEHGGVRYGQKAHALRALIDAPAQTGAGFALALGIDPAETRDIEALRRHGWQLIDPNAAAGSPDRYRDFVRSSWAEFGLAKEGYVASACGWFSDRSICYLASGRPVIAQDTGLSDVLPIGEGVVTFTTLEEAADATRAVGYDYARHARAARRVAEEYFDSSRVLGALTRKLDLC